MAMMAEPLRTMKQAIQVARQTYPGYERESGTQWPDIALDPAEALLFAFAALAAYGRVLRDRIPLLRWQKMVPRFAAECRELCVSSVSHRRVNRSSVSPRSSYCLLRLV
jgi:hypothetical protein